MRRKRSFSVISVSSRESKDEGNLSDDDAGNADLTLDILAKASSRNRDKSQGLDGNFMNGLVEILSSSDVEDADEGFKADRQHAKPDETPASSVVPGLKIKEADEQIAKIDENERPHTDGKKKSKKKKRKIADVSVDHTEKLQTDSLFTVIADDGEDNLEMRKLLRGPRYFDLPEEKTCFRCGNTGHTAADCTEELPKKACHVCGSLDHEGKECPLGSCFICKGTGHFARSCPNKANCIEKDSGSLKFCLRCGDVGHEMNVCDRDYHPEDLKAIQCYVCKEFGHLCCADMVDSLEKQVSCYNCGELGHTGVGCAWRRSNGDSDKKSAKVCYKCGEEGHFARGCSKRYEAAFWPDPRTSDMRNSQMEDEIYGFKSVPAVVGRKARWLDMQQEKRRAHTPGMHRWPERWRLAKWDR